MNNSDHKTIMELLGEIEDKRTGNAVRYRLDEVLMIGILSILCNAKTFTGMEIFGQTHEAELRKYMELANGIPSHDTFGDIFSRIDPAAVSRCFDIFLGNLKDEIESKKKGEKTEHSERSGGPAGRKDGRRVCRIPVPGR